jgi:hypothetical protein
MPSFQKPKSKRNEPPVNSPRRSAGRSLPSDQPFGRDFSIGETTDPSSFQGPAQQNRGISPLKSAGHVPGQGDGTRQPMTPSPSPGSPPTSGGPSPTLPSNVVNQIVLQHLQAIGQAPGPQPGSSAGPQLAGQGLPQGGLGGGDQSGMGPGQAGPGGMGAGGAAGQNPLAPELGQILNPRQNPVSGPGGIPTLPGAPQGFDLWHMLQNQRLFEALYRSLPIGGQSLPAGQPGSGY